LAWSPPVFIWAFPRRLLIWRSNSRGKMKMTASNRILLLYLVDVFRIRFCWRVVFLELSVRN